MLDTDLILMCEECDNKNKRHNNVARYVVSIKVSLISGPVISENGVVLCEGHKNNSYKVLELLDNMEEDKLW